MGVKRDNPTQEESLKRLTTKMQNVIVASGPEEFEEIHRQLLLKTIDPKP